MVGAVPVRGRTASGGEPSRHGTAAQFIGGGRPRDPRVPGRRAPPSAADPDDRRGPPGRPGAGHRRPAQGWRRYLAPLRRPRPRGPGAAPSRAVPGRRRPPADRRRRPPGPPFARRRSASAGMDGQAGGLAAMAADRLADHRGGPFAGGAVARLAGRRRRGPVGAGLSHRQPSRSQTLGAHASPPGAGWRRCRSMRSAGLRRRRRAVSSLVAPPALPPLGGWRLAHHRKGERPRPLPHDLSVGFGSG